MPEHRDSLIDSQPVLSSHPPDHGHLDEKIGTRKSSTESIDIIKEKQGDSEGGSQLESKSDQDGVRYVNGEPVISNGRDVSQYLVDVRDDGDPPLTFRSMFLGTVFAGLGASLYQVFSISSTRNCLCSQEWYL